MTEQTVERTYLGFSEIIGHSDLIEEFKEGVQKKTFSGSYLFSGSKGIGKCTISRILSKYIICSGLRDEYCACETCSLFPYIPDYKEIGLPSDKDTIGVEDLSQIRDFLSLYPFQGEKRVLLVDDADRLTLAASNEFLKITEELSDHNIIIFITSRSNEIIPTLRSRLQHVHFKNLEVEDILSLLRKRGMSSGRLREIGGVAPFLSQSLLTDVDKYLEQQSEVFQFVKTFGRKKEEEILKKIDEWDEKHQLVHFMEMLVVVLTDFLKLYYDSIDLVSNGAKIDVYEEIYKVWSMDLIFVTIDSLRKNLTDYERNPYLNLKHRVKTVISTVYLRSQIWK